MTITPKGQITIPKTLRDKYGLDEHTEIEFIDDGDAIHIVKKGRVRAPAKFAYGILGLKGKRTDDLVKKMRET